jgi:hypothetical protein
VDFQFHLVAGLLEFVHDVFDIWHFLAPETENGASYDAPFCLSSSY